MFGESNVRVFRRGEGRVEDSTVEGNHTNGTARDGAEGMEETQRERGRLRVEKERSSR